MGLFEAAPHYYEHLTRAALGHLSYPIDIQKENGTYRYTASMPDHIRRMSRLDWMVRSWQGKLLSVLRLLKGLLTFRGGVDYILWKIERATCVIFWKLYRRGAYR
jgi:hypothetical protein